MHDGKIDIDALKRLLKIIGGEKEDLCELLDEYLETAPELAAEIARAATAEDRNALRIAAHTLKSNARDFGAISLSELCATLEDDCRGEWAMDHVSAASEIAAEELMARQALRSLSIDALAQGR